MQRCVKLEKVRRVVSRNDLPGIREDHPGERWLLPIFQYTRSLFSPTAHHTKVDHPRSTTIHGNTPRSISDWRSHCHESTRCIDPLSTLIGNYQAKPSRCGSCSPSKIPHSQKFNCQLRQLKSYKERESLFNGLQLDFWGFWKYARCTELLKLIY